VFAGIISETKGQFQLIEAMKIMPEELRKYIRVDFYGGGRKAYIDHLKRYVEKHGLSECISFKGYSSDLPKILPDYDIGVVASRSEAFGRVTAEYMAAGLLVIASDTGANPEIVTHWKDGLIYEYGNTTELQSWLAVASACPEDYRGLRETAFRSVREKYSMDRCADEIYKEYRKAVRK
jgi:glycosyltransferase involved in cell wall biosynthesis